MIARIWKGLTTRANAKAYEELLKNEIFPKIKAKSIEGFISISLLKRELKENVEFITIIKFESLEAVKVFAGKNFKKSYVPQKAKLLLFKYDKQAKHYNIINE